MQGSNFKQNCYYVSSLFNISRLMDLDFTKDLGNMIVIASLCLHIKKYEC